MRSGLFLHADRRASNYDISRTLGATAHSSQEMRFATKPRFMPEEARVAGGGVNVYFAS